jgi:uncharacterized protein (TIGR02147 family)
MEIFDFDDYKIFLKNEIKKKPNNGHGVLAKLAVHLDINSTLISQILSGDKDFTLEQAKKIADYFSLEKMELDYFLLLIQIERAGDHELKTYFIQKRDLLKTESLKLSNKIATDKEMTSLEKSIFYSSKIYSSVHLFCSVDSGKTLLEIQERFELSPQQAALIVQFLLSARLIEGKNDIYKMSLKSTHLESTSPLLINHHKNWRIAAINKAENLAQDELMYTGNISLSKSDFLKIRAQLVTTIKDALQVVKDSPAEEVANINIDLFWS